MSYEIVKYTPEFKGAVLQLQRYLWGPDIAVNAAYLGWKHERNPYVPEPLIYLALHGTQVVGMRAMFGAKWLIDGTGRTLLSVCAGDLVIAPEHRNQGLFSQIMQLASADLADRGYNYMFNLSAGAATLLSSLATGWRGIGSLKPVEWKGTESPSAGAANEANNFDSLDRHAARADVTLPVMVEAAPRPEAMAGLVARIAGDARLRHIRDEQYFRWRFDNPRSIYRFLYCGLSPLEGYLVLRSPSDARRAKRAGMTIVDWEATTDPVRAVLLQAATEWGHFDRLTVWSATLPGDTQTILRDHHFTPAQTRGRLAASRPTLLVRPVRKELLKGEWMWEGRRLLDLTNWNLRMIDSDGQ